MALLRNEPDAPHLGTTVLIAPGRRINLAQAGHPLASLKATTALGRTALKLAIQSSAATIQIIATSTYVNTLTALQAPNITFAAPPPGTTGITVQQLQSAYQTFEQQLSVLQGQAQAWIATSGSTGGTSIMSNLVSAASMIAGVNQQVQTDFALLKTLPVGSKLYNDTLSQLQTLVGAEVQPLTSLSGQITTLGQNLSTAATTLTNAATTGVLSQLVTAYQNEITALNNDIKSCNDAISTDNSKIIGLGFAAGAAIVVGLVGLMNFWNPLGWILMAGGGVGAYFAITEIESLKGQIAVLRQQIQNDTDQSNLDKTAAQIVSSFANSANAAAQMNSAAQQELSTLIQLCNDLAADMNTALSDISSADFTDALAEWNEVVAAAAFLGTITAYTWPSMILLQNPTQLAATGNNAFLVSNSGAAYQFTIGGNTWTQLPGSSLSIVAADGQALGIDGAPNCGTSSPPNPYGQTFLAKSYGAANSQWTTISTFPAAQLAIDNAGNVWAVNQTVADRQAYRYSGSGTVWNPVGAMPNSDAPGDIAGYGGTLFAIGINGRGLWYLASGTTWTQIGTATYSKMSMNSGWLGLVDTSGNSWLLDVHTAGSYSPVASMTSVSLLAQAPNGDQYATDASLNLWHVVQSGGSATSTQLKAGIVGVTVGDAGSVYALDNSGEIWLLTNAGANTWQQLPPLPTGSPSAA